MTYRTKGSQTQLVSRTGKVLGTHSSIVGAESQERAIQASKHAKAAGKYRKNVKWNR